jgi:hypothetical protein
MGFNADKWLRAEIERDPFVVLDVDSLVEAALNEADQPWGSAVEEAIRGRVAEFKRRWALKRSDPEYIDPRKLMYRTVELLAERQPDLTSHQINRAFSRLFGRQANYAMIGEMMRAAGLRSSNSGKQATTPPPVAPIVTGETMIEQIKTHDAGEYGRHRAVVVACLAVGAGIPAKTRGYLARIGVELQAGKAPPVSPPVTVTHRWALPVDSGEVKRCLKAGQQLRVVEA